MSEHAAILTPCSGEASARLLAADVRAVPAGAHVDAGRALGIGRSRVTGLLGFAGPRPGPPLRYRIRVVFRGRIVGAGAPEGPLPYGFANVAEEGYASVAVTLGFILLFGAVVANLTQRSAHA